MRGMLPCLPTVRLLVRTCSHTCGYRSHTGVPGGSASASQRVPAEGEPTPAHSLSTRMAAWTRFGKQLPSVQPHSLPATHAFCRLHASTPTELYTALPLPYCFSVCHPFGSLPTPRRSAFFPQLAVFPVMYLDSDLCVFKFTPLDSLIAVHKVAP